MNREQMIEKVWAEMWQEPQADAPRRIVDAILPQVTTVEELLAQPDMAILLYVDSFGLGQTFSWFTDNTVREAEELVSRGPLTVVWQP